MLPLKTSQSKQCIFVFESIFVKYQRDFQKDASASNNVFVSIMPDDSRGISQNTASLKILVHDAITLLYYEHWTDKRKSFSKY